MSRAEKNYEPSALNKDQMLTNSNVNDSQYANIKESKANAISINELNKDIIQVDCIDSTKKKNENEVDSSKSKEIYKNLTKILSLLNSSSRDKALMYLFKNRDKINGLAKLLWYTPGVITVFIQEIIKMYAMINEKLLKKEDILNCYNIISLFQLLVMDSEIKTLVIKGKLKFLSIN